MRRIFAGLLLSVFILAVISTISSGRKTPGRELPKKNAEHFQPAWRDRPLESMEMQASALADTYVLAKFDFEGTYGADPQGWYAVDLSLPAAGTFFHVDDFAGLGGGSYGGLVPIEGGKSLWCGTREDSSSSILCSYAKLPGYGNNWYQRFESVEISHSGDVTLEFLAHYDSEPGYDKTHVQYESITDNWVTLITLDGDGDLSVSEVIPEDSLDGPVTLRFLFESDGAWSDEDGSWDTDGAIVIDSLVVRDSTGVLNYQNFEVESVGDTATIDGTWMTRTTVPFGIYAGLFSGTTVLQEDRCEWNYSSLWGFFKDSPDDFACEGHPEQKVVPYGKDTGEGMLYFYNEVWSPLIDYDHDIHGTPVPSTADETYFQFDVYADMPLNPLIGMFFHIRSWQDNCPGVWKDRAFADFYDGKKWMHFSHFYADLVDPGAEYVQLALGAIDMYQWWYIVMGNGACHTHAPLYDNVSLIRVDRRGPRWSVQNHRLFQDTFPENGTGIGTGRIDMATDRLYSSNPNILPGDSAQVYVEDPISGLREPEPYTGFGSAVYFYMRRDPVTKPMPSDKIVEDSFRWPLVDSLFCDSRMWYVFRCDTVFLGTGGGPRTVPLVDQFCVDINDHYFTNGDTIWYFFGGENAVNQWSWWTQAGGTVSSIGQACEVAMEMQILPAGGLTGATDILYVDDFDGQGAQPYFDSAFELMGITPDRYDVLYPRGKNGNSPGGRVTNVVQQLIPYYRKIIWNTGSGFYGGILGDGDEAKADDYTLLYDFLDQHTSVEGVGVYLSGDEVAYEWDESYAAGANALKSTFINHNLVSESHRTPIDYGVAPLVIGELGSIFDHLATGVDTMIAFGGCPELNEFDVMEPLGMSTLEMTYNNPGNPQSGAVIANVTTNSQGNPARFVLAGFSYHYAYDEIETGIPDRVHHLTDIIRWLGNDVPDPTIVGPLSIFDNSLSQNFPNPFNPVTTIRYSIKENAHVSLKVYNVAGRLVKTLVNEIKQPGLLYEVRWEGRSDSGDPVASGVYFYKIVTKDFSKTKKMVLLK